MAINRNDRKPLLAYSVEYGEDGTSIRLRHDECGVIWVKQSASLAELVQMATAHDTAVKLRICSHKG